MSKSNPLHYLDISRNGPSKITANLRVAQFKEIYNPFSDEELKKQSGRCLSCGNPYCEWKCPLHNYIPNWLAMVEEGRYVEAAELMHNTNSLPEICGRVCPQDRLCEGSCTLNDEFGAVTIGSIEQTITDKALASGWVPDLSGVINTGKKVAIIGAGPAGLGCADILVRNGVDVDVYDRNAEIGGLLTFGIPSFKLEKSVIKKRRQIFKEMGVNFHLKQNVDEQKFAEIESEYDAVFLGLGAYNSIASGLKKDDSKGVYQALHYLSAESSYQLGCGDEYINLSGKKVAVLGGGDTAMDCTRTAIRQGASEVYCIYRRDKDNMPGSSKEIENALEEGVVFMFCAQATELLTEHNQVIGLRVIKTELGEKDATGRQSPQIVPNSDTTLDVDAVIVAFGFNPSPENWFDKFNIKQHKSGKIDINNNKLAYQTANDKVFCGGDMVRGSDLVVTAVYEGREAAKSIINYLKF